MLAGNKTCPAVLRKQFLRQRGGIFKQNMTAVMIRLDRMQQVLYFFLD
jgi:hypothetical protein